jgi:hypothetical protein
MGRPPIVVDNYSVCAVPIEMRFRDQALSNGSAFFWRNGTQIFLVTNWHNVSGVNPSTGENLSATGGRPDRIIARCFGIEGPGIRVDLRIGLFADADGGPRWLEHPEHGRLVDVVIIPMDEYPQVNFHPINEAANTPLRMGVGQDVYILGFPFGMEDRAALPVWKRGSIATEPDVLMAHELFTLVDTASRPGMSGSPVIVRNWGFGATEDGNFLGGAITTRFFGIYAGRLVGTDALDAQLGRVFPAKFLEEIVANPRRGDHP